MASAAGASAPTELEHSRLPDRAGDDADTCRICRGEGSPEEPLFYPCKCSGSIKFVHQECLMEWLSHSQKKYCELCKTSFRFTKLYHPGMPTRIPTSVFIRRAAIHVLKMLVTWCRAVLVGSVWLVLLPYSMRVVWRSLFWVGDGGWSRELYAHPTFNGTRSLPGQSWDLTEVQAAIASARASNSSVDIHLPGPLTPFSQLLNLTAGDSLFWTLTKRFFFGVSYPLLDLSSPTEINSTAVAVNATEEPLGSRNPSLLSDISFFKWFPSHAANRFLIDVLEGQIITLLVVVAFILIFLIREWVVQQQPVINMVALGDDAGAERPPVAAEPVDEEADEHLEEDDNDPIPGEYDEPDDVLETEDGAESSDRDPQAGRDRTNFQKRQAILRLLRESDDVPQALRDAIQDAIQSGQREDVERVIDDMPLLESLKLREKLITLSERWQEADVGELEEHNVNSSESSRLPATVVYQPNSSEWVVPEQSSSSSHGKEREVQNEVPERTSSPQRPNMPTRNRSSIVTEIRRNMEEGETWSFADAPPVSDGMVESQPEDVPDSWDDEPASPQINDTTSADIDPDSENSSESWQQVPDIVVEDVSDTLQENVDSIGKGKQKSLEINPDGTSHDEGTSGSVITAERPGTTAAPNIDAQIGNDKPHETHNPRSSSLSPNDHPQSAETTPARNQIPAIQDPAPPQRLLDTILDWLFGDIAPGVQAAEDEMNDEHIVQDLADEAPFVPFAANEPAEPANPPIQDPEVAAAAVRAGIDVNDQDAIDDAEDLEGIMELIGMQGPLTGLFQNAMFSAVLISATLACAVWFPYLWGKVVILFMGSPISLFIKLPLQFIAALADILVDASLLIAAWAVFWSSQFVQLAINILTFGKFSGFLDRPFSALAAPARSIAENAIDRIGHLIFESSPFPHPDYFRLSINSHAALRSIQNTTNHALNQTSYAITAFYNNVTASSSSEATFQTIRWIPTMFLDILSRISVQGTDFVVRAWNSKTYKITLDLDPDRDMPPAYGGLEPWTATDRLIAICAGYAFFALAGAIYLRRGKPISTSQQGRKIEGIIAEVLQQAGGVLKVILIISIEMLAFPLYCGLLLDVALLPLFKDTSVYARWRFARESPWTSGFVHWFIGTCYMFHFALFVSMCRKIMRKGVLYFIRDPDDPTFHPVRDVLERSVTTQLRKIAFSALVYGALVIICLGGVVWGLSRATEGVLPIHWTSQAPSLEFPLDLLFYNFLTPFVIKFFKPSDGLHTVYQWWFKSCARLLRLTNFLFGEKVKEEEGRYDGSTWISWFARVKGKPDEPQPGVRFLKDGKFVRAPASDQARIPRGQQVFVEVDESNERKDGKSDDGGIHNDLEMVTMVYIPPWFRVRIFCFVLTIWIFAAITGIGITIIPLLFGRYLFSLLLPSDVEMNDIHAFSLGIYSLGTVVYSGYHLCLFVKSLDQPIPSPFSTIVHVATTVARFALRVIRFIYVWTTLVFIIPFLFAMLLELFFLMPLHAYLGPSEPHVVHIIQDWTLGFLYARLAARVIFSDRTTRAARAFSAVIADGYLNPNARLATRCFLLPVSVLFGVAVTIPSLLAWTLNRTVWLNASAASKGLVWRFSYPALGICILSIWAAKEGLGMLKRWRMVVRDEVYLIGERLHNFGERRAPGAGNGQKLKSQ